MVFAATPDQVFAALADGDRYDQWVVGAREIRATDPDFPRPGAKVHHRVGVGPIEVKDTTKVEAAQPGHRLRLEARVRPMGVAVVDFALEPVAGGTKVIMEEHVRSPFVLRALDPALTPLVNARNVASLKKLKTIVESGAYGR